jgi:benzylsuccinate CoA-transferase BbsE subunit
MTAMHGGLLAWDRFLLWMGQERPDVAEEFGKPQWLDMRWRRTDEAKRQFRTLFESFSLSRDKRALFVEGQRMGVGIGPLADTVDLLNSPQLTERDFIRDVVLPDGRSACLPGAPFRMSETPAQVYLYRPAELVAGSAS